MPTSAVNGTAATIPDLAIPATAQTVQAIAPATPAPLPTPGGLLDTLQSGPFGEFAHMLAIFFLVLALVCLCLWLVRRLSGKYLVQATPRMALEGRLSIGPKRWIMLVRVDSKRLILGLTDQHIVMLSELPDDSLPDTVQAQPGQFPGYTQGQSFGGFKGGQHSPPEAPGNSSDPLIDFAALLDGEGRKK